MTDEPEYLQRLRQRQREQSRRADETGGGSAAGQPNQHEQEALRWARELAKGAELRSVRNLPGAKFAALIRIQAATGLKFLSLEGFSGREALIERVKPGATVGEEVLGAYEVKGGRPVDITVDDNGQVALRMGPPRPGANPISPEKMIRRAQAEAVQRAKTMPRDRDRDRGGRGRR